MTISVYYGDEDYLLQQAVKRLRSSVINPAMGGLGHKILENPRIGDVLEVVGAVYFNLGGKTLIEIQNFSFLHKAASASADEKSLAELMSLLENLGESKHVLFVSEKVNRTVKFPKWLLGGKAVKVDVHECKTPAFWQTDEAIRLLIQESRMRDIQLEPAAAQKLVEHQGVQLRPLMSEVEKLAVYAAGRAITVADVARLSSHDENTFRMLSDWLHQKNRAEVLQTLDELLLRQHPIPIFALAQSWLGNLFKLRYWQQQGVTDKEMAERTKKHPYKIKMDLQEHGRVPMERIDRLRAKMLDLEWKAKTGGLPARLALEILLSA
jgi:DNA polymerase III subunit delta